MLLLYSSSLLSPLEQALLGSVVVEPLVSLAKSEVVVFIVPLGYSTLEPVVSEL